MHEQAVLPSTAEMSGLVQQLLIAQGARYASVVNERTYKRSAVVMRVPENNEYGRRLPAGDYLVMPWDGMRPQMLHAYLQRLMAAGSQPDFVIIVATRATFEPTSLFEIGALFAVELAVVDVGIQAAVGSPRLRNVLDQLFDPDAADALRWANPLSHMTVLADPRDPRVFFERLRHANPNAGLTKLLIGLNVLVFIVMKLTGDSGFFAQFSSRTLVDWGANVAALTVGESQPWRLVTCTFLHADMLHIGFNMYALKVLGDTAERLFGTPMFGALYAISALGGSVASLAFTLAAEPMLPSVGASGAVFGVMGGLLGFALAKKGSVPRQVFVGLTRSALMFIGINVAIGLAVSFIDNAAHLGGLGAGTIAGLLLSRELPPATQPSSSVRGAVIVGMLLVLAVGYYAAASGISSSALRAGW